MVGDRKTASRAKYTPVGPGPSRPGMTGIWKPSPRKKPLKALEADSSETTPWKSAGRGGDRGKRCPCNSSAIIKTGHQMFPSPISALARLKMGVEFRPNAARGQGRRR